MKRIILCLTIICTMLVGCKDSSQDDYLKLKSENERLKSELDECRFGAKKLLTEAELSFKNKDYQKVKELLSKLIEKHPASEESELGKILLAKSENAIHKIENEIKLAEEKEKREKEAAIATATKSMFKKYNEFTETFWYQDASSPRYVNRNGFYLEFGRSKSGSLTDIFINIQYYAEDWLFIEHISFTIDGNPFRYYPGYMERDSGDGGKIWEWKRTSLTQETYAIIKNIINSKVAKIRYSGKQYYDDRVISQTEKKALQNVLLVYEALGGVINLN